MNDEGKAQKQIATLLHELRQPLNMIMLSCNNMQNRAKIANESLDDVYLMNKTNLIISAVQKSSKIIEKIEAISQKTEIS